MLNSCTQQGAAEVERENRCLLLRLSTQQPAKLGALAPIEASAEG